MTQTKCPACSGTGLAHGGPATPPCRECDGDGYIIHLGKTLLEQERDRLYQEASDLFERYNETILHAQELEDAIEEVKKREGG